MKDYVEESRAAFESFLRARGFDTTIYGDGNYSDEVMDLHAAWLAAIHWARTESKEG